MANNLNELHPKILIGGLKDTTKRQPTTGGGRGNGNTGGGPAGKGNSFTVQPQRQSPSFSSAASGPTSP